MTVRELQEKLSKLPSDAHVVFSNGEYKGSTSHVHNVKYVKESTLGQSGNTVILS